MRSNLGLSDMERTITISEDTYAALQRESARSQKSLNSLAEEWLKQHLDLARYPELEWREGPGGWRAGIRDTAIDVYTVVGYSVAGYSPQEIAEEMLPRLSTEQVEAALRYYAEYPEEIDKILAESQDEATKAQLYRSLGPSGYRRLLDAQAQSDPVNDSPANTEDKNSKSVDEHD